MNIAFIQRGSFTSDGASKQINLPSGATYFKAHNLTQAATTQATGRGILFEWYPSLADGYAVETKKTNSTDALNQVVVTSGGFTYRVAPQQPEAAFTITGITNATPAVVTTSAPHGYSNGDRVRIYGTTGALQYSGMDFTVSSVSSTNFTLLGLNTPGSAATAGFVRRIAVRDEVVPEYVYITAVTQAVQGVVTTALAHNFVVDQVLYFSVPADFGMTQLSGISAKVVAVGTYTVTLDLNTSGFSAFAFPTSASSPVAFPMVASSGQRNAYNVTTVPFHSGNYIPNMLLAAGAQSPAGSTSDVIQWEAHYGVEGIN